VSRAGGGSGAPTVEEIVKAGTPLVEKRPSNVRKKAAPYWLAAPGALYLAVFFLVPIGYMAYTSLWSGFLGDYSFTWNFSNYRIGLETYGDIFIRSLIYAGIVTVLALVLAYPVAYWIAFYGGARKNVFLLLLLLPFFVSFIIRTVQWEFLLRDNGFVLTALKTLGVVPDDYRVLGTTVAVISGITYNFLPFTALPLYVALERIDKRLVEAGKDLYAGKATTFRKVVWPLSLPGVFAAFLLTFIPAVGDYVNASVLGGPGNTMIGNVIQTEFLVNFNYPVAAAMSFLLIAALLIGATVYARVLGTEEVTSAAVRA
jgi:spermidine/putrescine transport system permease protein